MSQPIKLYSHASGPNPWKVALILNELNVPYNNEMKEFTDLKQEPFTSVNPNGRVPAIVDPNTNTTLWESGAILEYLVDKYDKSNNISYPAGSPERYQAIQWLMFQMSGQGPYFGQAAWFGNFHHEKLPSAIERYQKEVERVVGVIDSHLAKTGKPFLTGDKCTYADLAFVPWNMMIGFIHPNQTFISDGKYPKYKAWMDSMSERPAVKKTLEEKNSAAKK